MQKITGTMFFLSTTILVIGSVVGWVLTQKLADTDSAYFFLKLSVLFSALITFSQLFIFKKSQHQMYFQLLFLALLGLTMMWMMLCLFLPVFWMNDIDLPIKLAMAAIFIYIAIGNVLYSHKEFERKWLKFELSKEIKAYLPFKKSTNWEAIALKLDLQGKVYILGFPKFVANVFSVLMIPSMLLGLSLRSAYPDFSVFAWGVPSAMIAAFFLQMAGYNLAQAKKIKEIQSEGNFVFNSSN